MERIKDEIKLSDERNKYKKKCNCGHSVLVLPTFKREYVICSYCHKKVFKDDKKQKEQNEKVKRENFRMKMWGLI